MLVSLAAVLLVVASAGFGMLFAWTTTSKQSELLGVLSVAMALGCELSKPFAIASAFSQLSRFRIVTAAALTVVGLLAVAFSLQSELTFMSMTRGDLVAMRAGEHDAAQRAAERYENLTVELSQLKPASTRERDVDAYEVQRKALTADLRQAELDRRQAPAVVADPGATALATYAQAMGVRVDAQTLGLFLPLVGVLALELGAAFSVVLVRSVTGAQVAHVAHVHSAGNVVAHNEAAGGNIGEGAPPNSAKRPTAAEKRATPARRRQKRRDDDDDQAPRKRGLTGLLDAVQGSGGKVVALSQRKLARKIGVSRRTLERAMRDAAEAGAAMLETGRSGTRLALA
jgi:hypothetical protein